MERGKFAYYLSLLTAVVIGVLILLELNSAFELFDMYGSRFLMYAVYYSAALLIPLVLLSSILAFRASKSSYGKKSIRLLVNTGIVYAVIKIILVIYTSFRVFEAGVI